MIRPVRGALALWLAIVVPLSLAAQRGPALDLTLPAPAALSEEGPTVRVRNVLSERRVMQLLRNGFPAELNYRVELWSTGGFSNSRLRQVQWDVLVRYDALQEQYEVVRVRGDSVVPLGRFSQFADAVAEIERPVRAPITARRQRAGQYYVATLQLTMLSVTDLDEVERWLRGELKPAVRGERNPGTAVGRGMRTLLTRVLGGETRRLETRTPVFRL